VDIIIGDGIDVCWIQVKRSSFRLTPYAKRSEELMSDFKANDQLLRAEVHFEDSPFLQTFGSPTMKWIVSTSFEGVNVENNGIIKFNYFELLRALKNPAIRNLVHLRDYLIHDTEIVHFGRGLLSKKVSDDFLAVMAGEYSGMELFGSPDCMKSVGILPGESAEHRYRMFNDAASLRESYGAREAISGFRRYVEQYPNDPEGWIELSNCFADTRQIDVAIEVLQKGLNLFPDCPVISRNLAICLGEKGMHAESLKCYFRILQKYPGLRQPFVEAKQIWYLGLSKALFPSNELVQLSEEASRLGLNEE
jgi:hypothetical protein